MVKTFLQVILQPSIRSHFVVISAILLSCCTLEGQQRKISSVISKGVSDGLADRNILDVVGDSSGVYYFQTPLSLQKYYKNKIQNTLHLNGYSDGARLVNTDKYLYRISKENCISIVEKETFTYQSEVCLKDLNRSPPLLSRTTNSGLMLLFQNGTTSFELVALHFDGLRVVENDKWNFSYEDNIRAFIINESEEILIINDKDQLVVIGEGEEVLNLDCRQYSKRHEPKIFFDKGSGCIYFSLSICEGIFKYKDGIVQRIHDNGFIQNYNQDTKGNTLVGVTGSVRLHTDDLLLIPSDGPTRYWNKLLDYNNRGTNYFSFDFEESVLAASYNGVFYFDFIDSGVELYLHDTELQEGDFGFVIRSFSMGENDEILIAREGGGKVYRLKGETIKVDEDISRHFDYGTVWIDYAEDTGEIIILQYHRDGGSTLAFYNPDTKSMRKVSLPLIVGERFHLQSGYIWIIGRSRGSGKVVKLNRQNLTQELMFDNLLTDRPVRSSLFNDDFYLFGTRRGLIVYDARTESLVDSINEQIFDLSISHINQYDGKYFMGTYNDGVYVYDHKFESLGHLKVGDTEASNTVASIVQDNYKNYWISTFDGITIMDTVMSIVDKLHTREGVSYSEYNRSAFLKDDVGKLLFGNTNGIASIDPEKYFSNKEAAHILVDEVSVTTGSKRVVLEDFQETANIVGVPDRIEISSYRPDFNEKHQNANFHYCDVLVDPAPDSLYVTRNSIVLLGLEPGIYQVAVKSRWPNATEELVAYFTIVRDYSSIFLGFSVFLGVSFLSLIIGASYVRRIEKKNKEELEMRSNLAKVKMKALRSQLNPHFVFNALNSIQYYIQTNDKRQAREYLIKFGKLMRLVLESSHYDYVSISQEIEQLDLYFDLEQIRFEEKWSYEILVQGNIDKESRLLPSMLLQPIVENAVIHGVAHLPSGDGRIVVTFADSDGVLSVTVEDNGVGRKKALEISARKGKTHDSLSTSITNDRINLLNSVRGSNYKIEYMDQVDSDGASLGTTVIVYIDKSLDGST